MLKLKYLILFFIIKLIKCDENNLSCENNFLCPKDFCTSSCAPTVSYLKKRNYIGRFDFNTFLKI